MITRDITPNASYITNQSIHRLKEAARAQWADLKDVNEVAIGNPFTLRFYFNDGTIVTQQQVQNFVNSHDNSVLTQEENAESVSNNADLEAANIPNWSRWNKSRADQHFDTALRNPLNSLKNQVDGFSTLPVGVRNWMKALCDVLLALVLVLWAIAQMEIALRNKRWPHLEEN